MEIEGIRGIGAVRPEKDVWETAAEQMEQILANRKDKVNSSVDEQSKGNSGGEDEKLQSDEDTNQKEQLERLKEMIRSRSVRVKYREDVQRYAITVVDPDTEEVIREIPSEELLDSFAEMLKYEGIIVDKKG
ncbi:flagellar protein FlaG [Bilifractor sp. LCP21S3_A7]|uniref:flagellar protein FlaG n=1 Tax=Bilifractor sp. LCP21S3_A7 TaxID=3438738 RepID=UPI003F9379AE